MSNIMQPGPAAAAVSRWLHSCQLGLDAVCCQSAGAASQFCSEHRVLLGVAVLLLRPSPMVVRGTAGS